MNGARKIAAVDSAADGLRKGMRRYVGVTTDRYIYIIYISKNPLAFLFY
jgi:hypothetical protein